MEPKTVSSQADSIFYIFKKRESICSTSVVFNYFRYSNPSERIIKIDIIFWLVVHKICRLSIF